MMFYVLMNYDFLLTYIIKIIDNICNETFFTFYTGIFEK